MPKISVIIPVYNAEKYLRQCLNSVIEQTLRDIEIICVDDCSSDSSLKLLEEYANKDNRITIIKQQNLTAGAARNNGLKIATGEYVHFLDADDWLELRAYEVLYKKATSKAVEVCVFQYNKYDNITGEFTPVSHLLDYPDQISNFAKNSRFFLYNAVVPWNKICKRQFLIDNEIKFDEIVCANDRSFYIHVLLKASTIMVCNEYLHFYRINNTYSLIGETRSQHFNCHFAAYETIRNICVDLDDNRKSMIIDISIKDFLNFYHKADEKYKVPIYLQLHNYFQTMDISPCQSRLKTFSWHEEYEAIRNSPFLLRETVSNQEMTLKLKKTQSQLSQWRSKARNAEKELQNIYASKTFKIGRFITFVPRNIHYSLEVIKVNGFKGSIYKLGRRITHTVAYYLKKFRVTVPLYKFLKYVQSYGWKVACKKAYLTIFDKGVTKKKRNQTVIVSLTSFPDRMPTLHLGVKTLLSQSLKPDMVILWLAEEQFPGRERQLPSQLLALRKKGLTIKWCNDVRSYKKLIPTLKLYPDAIIITADDDNYYHVDWLKRLYEAYLKAPQYIHCHRPTKFYLENGEFRIISGGLEFYREPSFLNKPVGLGGILYPPRCFHEDVTNDSIFTTIAPTNDDIWFWLMATMKGTKVNVVKDNIARANYIEGTQEGPCLTKINDHGEKLFFQQLNNIFRRYPESERILRYFAEKNTKIGQIAEALGKKLSDKEVQYQYYKSLNPKFYDLELKDWFLNQTNSKLDMDKPKTFNEKIQWLKLYDSTALKTHLADKYLVREWVKEKIGEQYLIPLLGVWDKFDEINFDLLPDRFVLKANHGSGYNIIVDNKKTMDFSVAKEKFNRWINTNFAFVFGFELHYKDIPPKIIAEKYMAAENGKMFDYRFYCFDGQPYSIWVDVGSGTKEHKRDIYDLNWTRKPIRVNYPNLDKPQPMPKRFEEMKNLAMMLSQGFPIVRVDFYEINEQIYFGEITFTPQSGTGKWDPPEINFVYGSLIKLPTNTLRR